MNKEIIKTGRKEQEEKQSNRKLTGRHGNRKRKREAVEDEAWWRNELGGPKPKQLKIKI